MVHNDRVISVGNANYKFGPICYSGCGSTCGKESHSNTEVTFRVKMDAVSAQGLFLAGGSMFGMPGANLMVLNTKSGFYETTKTVPKGTSLTYAYTNGKCPDFKCKEHLAEEKCAAHWNHDDRVLYIPDREANAVSLSPVWFGHCSLAKPPTVRVTFYADLSQGVYPTVSDAKMAMSPHDVHEKGVYLAGGGIFGVPGDNPMSDEDGDNIFEISMDLEAGRTYDFTFVIGDDAVNWSGKENLQGHACAFGEWNDRQLTVRAGDTIVGPFCFGQCCSCEHKEVSKYVKVTFSVDMSEKTVSRDGLFLAGGKIFGAMQDQYKMKNSGNGLYTITVDLPAESHQHYIFANGKCEGDWRCKENLRFSKDKKCQREENFNDREMIVLGKDVVMPTVCFGECGACGVIGSPGRRSRRAVSEVEVTFLVNVDFTTIDAYTSGKLRLDGKAFANAADGNPIVSIAGGGTFGNVGDNVMLPVAGSPTLYTWTTKLKPNKYKYVFVNSQTKEDWNAKEQLAGLKCVDQSKDTNQYGDRDLDVPNDGTGKMTVGPLCYAQCAAKCVTASQTQAVKVTFRLDTALIPMPSNKIYLAGGGTFGVPGDNSMIKSVESDCTAGATCHATYTFTKMLEPGTYHYSYTNGKGSEWNLWETKEDLVGQGCAANKYNDRMIVIKNDPSTKEVTVNDCFAGCGTCSAMMAKRVSVTFLMDLGENKTSEEGVFVAGGGTFGNPGDNRMALVRGSKTLYSLTFEVPAHTHHTYTFSNGADGDWQDKEDLKGATCAVGQWDDREFTVGESDLTLGPFCFGKCCSCGDPSKTVKATFKLAMLNKPVSDEGLYLAGGTFGVPGAYRLMDDGQNGDENAFDGIYTIVVDVPAETHQYYAFTNGVCKDFTCKEKIEGKACAFGQWGDRYVAQTGKEDFEVEHCFGQCTLCRPKQSSGAKPVPVTFSVDMKGAAISKDGVFLSGGMFGEPGNPAYEMQKFKSTVYQITVPVAGSAVYNFKFANGKCKDYKCAESFAADSVCTQTQHSDRVISVGTKPYSFGTVCYNTCGGLCAGKPSDTKPSGTADVTFQVKMTKSEVSASGLYLAGGEYGDFGKPGQNQLKLNSKTGFYEITYKGVDTGHTLSYTFTNGACLDWQCKESLAGKKCAAWWHHNDRALYVPLGTKSLTLEPVYFGHCSLFKAPKVPVSFFVDLRQGVYNTVGNPQLASSPHDIHTQGVSLAGGGTFGVPGDNPMHDHDGDLVFETTIMLEQGSTHGYAFVLGNDTKDWSGKEQLAGHGCAFGEFNDRQLTVGFGEAIIGPYCFGQCCSCEVKDATSMVKVRFSVDMSQTTVSQDGVFLAGGAQFGMMKPEYKMKDSGQGVYTITVELPVETHQHYIFTNGKCGTDWSCKENLKFSKDKKCQREEHYNDREIVVLDEDIDIPATCYAECGPCSTGQGARRSRRAEKMVSVTFQVNTDVAAFGDQAKKYLRVDQGALQAGKMSVAGGGVFGQPGDNKMKLQKGSTTVYEWTTDLRPGEYMFAFVNSHGPDPEFQGKENLVGSDKATCVDQNKNTNQWTDRSFTVPANKGDTMTVGTFCFGQCSANCVKPTEKKEVKVTFNLDMGLVHKVAGRGIFLAGGGMFGNPGDNQMQSSAGVCKAGTSCYAKHSITMMVVPGDYVYSYTNGLGTKWNAWETKEDLAGQSCAANEHNDRKLTVPSNVDKLVVDDCFGGCDSCDKMMEKRVTITFIVDMKGVDVAKEGIHIAGGGTFGEPGDNKMVPMRNHPTKYTIKYEVPAYTHHLYAFVNGNNDDWSGKEELTGAACAIGEFNDRGFEADESDMTLGPFCFGKCCSCVSGDRAVTMTVVAKVPAGTEVSPQGLFMSGGQFGAPGNPRYQLNLNSNGEYLVSLKVPPFTHQYWALANGNCPDYDCKEDLSGQACAFGTWNDRYIPTTADQNFRVEVVLGVCADNSKNGTQIIADNSKNGESAEDDSESSSNSTIIIVVVIVAFVFIIIVVVVAYTMIKQIDASKDAAAGAKEHVFFDNPAYASSPGSTEPAAGDTPYANSTTAPKSGQPDNSGYMDIVVNESNTDNVDNVESGSGDEL